MRLSLQPTRTGFAAGTLLGALAVNFPMLLAARLVMSLGNGSWFHQMNEKNEVIGTVWPGKSDIYHALQATLIPYHTPELSIAPAVKAGMQI